MSGPGGAWWRPPRDYCCGRYASYWNAFLFEFFFLQNPTFGYLPWPSQKLVSRTKRKTEKNQETPNPTKRPTLQNFDIRRALPVYISKFFGRANNKHFITASSYSNLYLICSVPNPRDSSTNIISKQNRQCFSCQNLVMFSTSNFTP